MIGQYPVTASLDRQKDLLSNITDHIVTPFERTIELEQKRMRFRIRFGFLDLYQLLQLESHHRFNRSTLDQRNYSA